MKLDIAVDGIASRVAAREAERARDRAIRAALADLARRRAAAGGAAPPQIATELPNVSGIGPPEPTPPES